MMKIKDIMQEINPCEVCGNREVNEFYFHVLVHQGNTPYVKCCECETDTYSANAMKVITQAIDNYRKKKLQKNSPVKQVQDPRQEIPDKYNDNEFLKAMKGIM